MKNLGNLMKQAQQMQSKMADMQAKMGDVEVEGSSGGGMVRVTVTGKGEARRIKIDPSLLAPDEGEVLEDLLVAAINDARGKSEAMMAAEMQSLTAGTQSARRIEAALLMAGREVEQLIALLARLPGLGPRSARRAALFLLKRREALLQPLAAALTAAAANVTACSQCGNLDTIDPCGICRDPGRDAGTVCVVEDVAGLWAMERTGFYKGRYHVLGGTLSALDGIGPQDLGLDRLLRRVTGSPPLAEVILAVGATVDGQTTAHYIADRLQESGVVVSGLAQGVPIGGELDFLDDGTIGAALKARRPV